MTNDKKNVVWNMIGGTASAFNSLFFAIIVTRINGENDAGIFSYSFASACLLYIVGLYAGRTFQVTDISSKSSDTDYIYHRILTCVLMIAVTVGFLLIKQYDMYKTTIFMILCIAKTIEAFAETLYALFQRNNELYKVGISLFMKSIISLIVFFIIDFITKDMFISCLSILVVNTILLIFYDFKNLKKIEITKTKITQKAIINLFKAGFFTFILTFLSQYLINATRYAIDDNLANEFQTKFGIIIMPATFMGLLGGYILQPCLVNMSNYIKNKEYENLKKLMIIICGLVILLGIIVLIVAIILEKPVLELVYNVSLEGYFWSMIIIILGSILYALSTMFSAVLIAMRKTFIQAVLYGITAIISTILAYVLVIKAQILGASITYCISMFIIATLLFIVIVKNMKKYKLEWKKNS